MNLFDFEITIFGELEPISPTLSKARCRTFYKGRNRNGGYITDEFAERLASSFPYTPIKGIYDKEEGDFKDHGLERTEGRIYGIVPQEPNILYEPHLDDDGVTREYCTADVYLYTALYEEARTIPGKSQSMELYVPSIKGRWEYIDGKKCFVYTDGCFLGLQVLGEQVEPCFEGAAFYSLEEAVDDELTQILNKYVLLNEEYKIQMEEQNDMDTINFKLSDQEKFSKIWGLLNPNYNEAGNYMMEYSVDRVYDDYALCYNYEQDQYYRVPYVKNDDDTVTLGERVEVFIVDVTKEEQLALQAVQAINGGSFAALDTNYQKAIDDLAAAQEENATFSAKVTELEEKIQLGDNEKVELKQQISTLNTERDNAKAENDRLNDQFNLLKEEKDNLQSFKDQTILNAKREIIDTYSATLDNAVIEKYTDEFISNFTLEGLEKELAYELVKTGSLFSKDAGNLHIKPNANDDDDPVKTILNNYIKE